MSWSSGIGTGFGANVVRAEKVMHGKTSVIKHSGEGLFRQLNNPLEVTRYHSLIISPESLSTDFVIDADTETEKVSARLWQ